MSDFGVNCVEFQTKDDQTICALCGDQAAFIPIYTCLQALWYTLLSIKTNRQKQRCRRYCAQLSLDNKRIFIRQKVQQELEENSSRDAVETAKSLTDKTFIDNVRRTQKSRRRPDGHCFGAVNLLQKTYEQEDRFCFTHSNSATLPYVIKSSRLKLQLLQNLDMVGNHRLSKETVTQTLFIAGQAL